MPPLRGPHDHRPWTATPPGANDDQHQADALDLGNATKFYAFEWTNPRLGKVIKEIRLNGSQGFKNYKGQIIPSNAVILAAVSVVPKREKPKQQNPPFPQ